MAIIAPNARLNITALSNGLKVVTIPIASELSTIGLWVKSGSIYETKENSGTAHFLEHVLFRGNSVYNQQRLERLSEEKGINLQAATARTTTRFYARVESLHIPQAIDTLSQIVLNPSIEDSIVENEKMTVLEEEREVARNFYETLWDKLHELSFPDSPIGFPILGTTKTIKSINSKMIRDFHTKFFNPSNCYFVCATKMEHNRVVDFVNKSTTFLKSRPPLDIDAIDKSVNCTFAPRAQVFGGKNLDRSWCSIGYQAPPLNSKLYPAVQLINNVIGKSDGTTPFEKSVFVNSPYVSKLDSVYIPYSSTGFLGFLGHCDCGRESDWIGSAMSAITHATVAMTDENLKMARLRLKDMLAKKLTTSMTIADEVGSSLLLQKMWLCPGEWGSIVDKITKDNLVEFARLYLEQKAPASAFFVDEVKFKENMARQQELARQEELKREEMKKMQEMKAKQQQERRKSIVKPWDDQPAQQKPSGILRP